MVVWSQSEGFKKRSEVPNLTVGPVESNPSHVSLGDHILPKTASSRRMSPWLFFHCDEETVGRFGGKATDLQRGRRGRHCSQACGGFLFIVWAEARPQPQPLSSGRMPVVLVMFRPNENTRFQDETARIQTLVPSTYWSKTFQHARLEIVWSLWSRSVPLWPPA